MKRLTIRLLNYLVSVLLDLLDKLQPSKYDPDLLTDSKDDLELQAIFDSMGRQFRPLSTSSPYDGLSYEEGLRSEDVITRVSIADKLISAYTEGTEVSDDLLTKAIHTIMEGLDVTALDIGQYRLLVDAARTAFAERDNNLLLRLFDEQNKLLVYLSDRTLTARKEAKGKA